MAEFDSAAYLANKSKTPAKDAGVFDSAAYLAKKTASTISPTVSSTTSTNTTPETPGYMARVQEDLSRSMEKVADIRTMINSDVYKPLVGDKFTDAGIRLASEAVNVAFSPVVEGIVSLWHGVSPLLENENFNTAMKVINPFYKLEIIKAGATDLALKAIDTETGKQGIQALNSGIDTYRKWAKTNPDDAKLIGAIINIAPFARAAKPTIGLPILSKIAGELDSSAAKQAAANRIAFLEDLTTPKPTAAIQAEQTLVETGGLLQGRKLIPQAEQQAQIDVAYKLPAINKGNTVLGNRNVVKSINDAEAKRLVDELEKPISALIPAPTITIKEIVAATNNAVIEASKLGYFGGKNKTFVKNAADQMRLFIGRNMALGTMSDSNALLQARKEFDTWVLDQSPDAFAAGNASKQTAAAKAVRDNIQDLVISKNPHVDVAGSLNMQSKLFGILDTLAAKVPVEANTNIGRAWQKISGLPGFKSKLIAAGGLLTGTGLLGASGFLSPIISVGIGGTFILSFGKKMLTSPEAKTTLSFMLKEIDKTVQSSRSARDIVALQLSKKTIGELINTIDMQDQKNPNAVQSQLPSGQPAVASPTPLIMRPPVTPPLPGPVAQSTPQDMPFNALQNGPGIAAVLRPQQAYRQAMTGIGGR
jgi:hypothetical protein